METNVVDVKTPSKACRQPEQQLWNSSVTLGCYSKTYPKHSSINDILTVISIWQKKLKASAAYPNMLCAYWILERKPGSLSLQTTWEPWTFPRGKGIPPWICSWRWATTAEHHHIKDEGRLCPVASSTKQISSSSASELILLTYTV